MEYIDGVDLRRWLEAAKRTHAEILEVFIAAGHGLKPANIMLGDDGRVRVVDFGLACSAGAVSEGAPTLDSSDSGQRLHAGVLTETGAVMYRNMSDEGVAQVKAKLASGDYAKLASGDYGHFVD